MTEAPTHRSLVTARSAPTLTELATQTLREAILRAQFKPNERLVERDLCQRTGVSRTCVRAALQQLEAEGLVARSPGRGLSVAAISPDEARQIYEVRAAIEADMVRHFVARAGASELEALKGALKEIDNAIRAGHVKRYVESLARFYEVILRGSRNEVAHRFLRTLDGRIAYLRALTAERAEPSRRLQTLALMTSIVEAVVARDADRSAELCRQFVERSADFALAVLAEHQGTSADARAEPRRSR